MRPKLLVAILLALASNQTATATLGPPIKLRILPQAQDALVVEIEAGGAIELSDPWIDGTGWSFTQLGKGGTRLEAGAKQQWTLRPTQKASEFMLHFQVQGQEHSYRIDPSLLRAERIARAIQPRIEQSAAPRGQVVGPKLELLPRTEAAEELGDDEAVAPKTPRNIRVHGRFIYERPNPGGGVTTLGADGLAVRIYDQDLTIRQLLASGVTDPYGYFDETFLWDQCCEADPDIVIEFEAENAAVTVEEPVFEFNYLWATGEWHNFTGTDLDLGPISPLYESDHPALHILSMITRAWRWLNTNEGYDTPHTDVQWPANWSGSFYNQVFNEIHIVAADQWLEWVLVHEYGHHWTQMFSSLPIALYCNGFCDSSPPLDCGHCLWCQENGSIAWGEGFADWIGSFLPATFAADYGVAANYLLSVESISPCPQDAQNHLPNWTEGMFAAVLNDIMDSAQDDDPYEPAAMDELAMGTNEIFDVAEIYTPTEPTEFLDQFLNQYNGVTSQLWATAKNNGYELDFAGPGQVTNIWSSHAINVPNGDPTPQFLWDIPTDNVSGVDGFSVLISTSPVSTPDLIADIGVQNFFDSAPLSPGTYYFSIRAVDRAGNWSALTASYGPFIVDVPEPADLTMLYSGGWQYPLVPRATSDATIGNVQVSPTLPSLSNGFWNLAYVNSGDLATSSGFDIGVVVDGVVISSLGVPAAASFDSQYLLNQGPVSLVGGRHTFGVILDVNDVIAETFETNNAWAHQWSWTPRDLIESDAPFSFRAPPRKDGGWSLVTDGSTLYDNCHGYRIQPVSDWHAVVADPDTSSEDYTVRLYAYDAGTSGFASMLHESSRPAGRTDAVLVNRNVDPAGFEDIGVLNESGGKDGYRVDWVQSTPLAFGVKQVITLNKHTMLALRHVDIGAAEIGALSISARSLIGTSYGIYWYDQGVGSASLDDGLVANSDARGRALLEPYAASMGSYALALVVDPIDKDAASQVEISVTRQLPNLLAGTPSNWHGPLVPLPQPTATIFSVPTPSSLVGNANSTYLNVAIQNSSPSPAGAFNVQARLDARFIHSIARSGVGGGSQTLAVNSGPVLVAGGRHTLSMWIDDQEQVAESDEEDNSYGEQWVWTPLDLASGISVTRTRPADRTAGWEDAVGAVSLWYNCDGLFMDDFGQHYQAIAVMPDLGSNVDLRLHEASTDAQSGFDASLAASSWGPEASDFVIVRQDISPRGFDVGVLAEGIPNGSYTAQAVESINLGHNPIGDHGSYVLDATQILQLFALDMDVGTWGFQVLQTPADAIDWGMSLHPPDENFFDKSTVLPNGTAWFEPAGSDEFISVDLDVAGYYCLSVWKVGVQDLAKAGKYTLRILDLNTIDTEAALPTRVALNSSVPNPFNPSTTLHFDLPEPGVASLTIFDASGRSVRRLIHDEWLPAGQHRARWNGTDERGQIVASGVYFARLRAQGREAVRKLTLSK